MPLLLSVHISACRKLFLHFCCFKIGFSLGDSGVGTSRRKEALSHELGISCFCSMVICRGFLTVRVRRTVGCSHRRCNQQVIGTNRPGREHPSSTWTGWISMKTWTMHQRARGITEWIMLEETTVGHLVQLKQIQSMWHRMSQRVLECLR